MPIYDYQCSACQHRTEVIHGVNEVGPAACALCGGAMKKLFAPPSIHFKGTGWAKKERASSGGAKSSTASSAASAGSGSSGEGGAASAGAAGEGGSGSASTPASASSTPAD
jgi:putative FmdB family regulatory protein